MEEKDKQYILKNIHKESIEEISKKLGLKAGKIKRFLEREERGKRSEDPLSRPQGFGPDLSARKVDPMFIFILLAAGLLVYSNTFFCSFHLDDIDSIVDNPAIRHISDLGHIWRFWPTRFITYLSLAFNYHLDRVNVVGYHVFNLAVHLGSGLLVWWLSLLTFSTPVMKTQKIARHAQLISFFAGLVFVTHPIQTQAVTYIVQRAASLATFFYVASLSLYVKSRLAEASGRWKFYYTGSLITAILAMFTKEMAITLPLMICLYEFSFFKTKERFNWKRTLPFLFCLLIMPLTMLMTKSVNIGEMRRVGENVSNIPTSNYLLTQFRVVITYIRLLFLPVNQNLDYDYPVAKTLFELPVLASLFVLAGIFIMAIRLFRNHRLVSFGIFWFFLALLPESSFISIMDVIFEHRLYLPMAGFSLFLASGMYELLGKNNLKAMVAVFAVLIISASALTYARNFVWKDELALWNDTVRKSPNKARPRLSRGTAYTQKGDLDGAISDFNKAIEIKPDYAQVYNNRGLAYQNKGDYGRALLDYNKAIEIMPDYVDAYSNRGAIDIQKGDFDQALLDFNKAIEIKPYFAGAYSNRGTAHTRKGDLDRAIFDFNKAIEIKPDFAEAYYNRGLAYQKKGDLDRAVLDFNKAIGINPDYAEAYNNRGSLYQDKGDLNQAVLDYSKAIEIKPDFAEAHNNRGTAFALKGDFDRALLDFNKAIEIRPDYVNARNNRDRLNLSRQGQP